MDWPGILDGINILPRRISLDTPGVRATIPMLRGVWGAALHDLDPVAYREVFEGDKNSIDQPPGYIFRPASPDPGDSPALEFILLGDATKHDVTLMRAWDVASGMGLGPERRRFHVRMTRPISPSGSFLEWDRGFSGWKASNVRWPLEEKACSFSFTAPLRLVRKGILVENPSFTDMVVAGIRRVSMLVEDGMKQVLRSGQKEMLAEARGIPSNLWLGDRLDLVRYSGRQEREIDMQGVSGKLDLPDGPGSFKPLFAALQWLHIGKGSTMGMGQLQILPLRTQSK